MFWLSKPFSLGQIRQYLAFSGLEVTTDQNGRLVVYVIGGTEKEDAADVLKCVMKQNNLNAVPIPCNEKTRLFVQKKLTAIPT